MSDPTDDVATTAAEPATGLDRLNAALDRQQRGWREGHHVSVEELVAEHPALATESEALLELIQNEAFFRKEIGETPELADYQQRFPKLAEALRIQWAVEQFLFSQSLGGGHRSSLKQKSLRRIGRYDVLATLGHGGMGVAYKAWDPELKRVVGLKRLYAGRYASSHDLARFHVEAEAIARVRHAHVVQIHDIGEVEGEPFLAMEYCGGGTLAERWQGTPLPARDAALIIKQIAEGVAAAHAMHIVHRDLKPANVLLASGSVATGSSESMTPKSLTIDSLPYHPKVSDFGLAKLLDSDDSQTRTGTMLGTPVYMAPEQAFGRPGDVGPAADIYALGVMLYEALTGKPPFQGANPGETLDQVRRHEPLPPRRILRSVPADLETVALQCLQKEPAKRYVSARALADDLARFLQGQPVLARRVGPFERSRRWCTRNPIVASLLTLIFGLLVAVAVIQAVGNTRLVEALNEANNARRAARGREAEALVGKAYGVRQSRREGQRIAALTALQQATEIGRELKQPDEWFVKLRNEAIAALALPDLYITKQWAGCPEGTITMEVSADFTLYARGNQRGEISVRRLADDMEIAQLPGVGTAAGPLLSRDGREVFQWTGGSQFAVSRLWNLESENPKELCQVTAVSAATFMDLSEGRVLVCLHPDSGFSVHDVRTGQQTGKLAPTHAIPEPRMAAHPHEPLVAISSYRHGTVVVRDIRSGTVACTEIPTWPNGCRAAWHPSGKYLCITNGDTSEMRIYQFDSVRGKLDYQRTIPTIWGGGDPLVLFNQAGDRFISSGWIPTVHVTDFWTGKRLFGSTSVLASGDRSSRPFLSPQANQVALALVPERTGYVGIWSLADAREYRSIVTSNQVKQASDCFALHPGGRLVAQNFTDCVRMFDLFTGAEVALLKLPGPAEYRPECSLCFDSKGNLYTNSFAGALRWPVKPDQENPHRFTFGPPARLPFHPGYQWIATSDDGSVIAQAMWAGYGMAEYTGGWILHPNITAPRWVAKGNSMGRCCVSPDGKWVMFNDLVFDAMMGEEVWRTPDGSTVSQFSADGQWLLTDGCRAYAVGSWKPGPNLGPGKLLDCTADNSLAVLGLSNGVFRLVEMATGRELAQLEDPDQIAKYAVFSSDGTKLVAAASDGLRVWDLRRIRQELTKLGLDWDAPPYPAEKSDSTAVQPIEVEIVGADLIETPNPQAQGER